MGVVVVPINTSIRINIVVTCHLHNDKVSHSCISAVLISVLQVMSQQLACAQCYEW